MTTETPESMTPLDRTVRPDGAFVWWTPAPRVSRDATRVALATVALDRFTPARRRPAAVLRDALEAVSWRPRAGLTIEQLAGGAGWEVVRVGRRDEQNEHQHVAFARIDDAGTITTDLDQPAADALAQEYTNRRDDLDGDQITAALVETVAALSGLTIKRGFYWLPARQLDAWRRLRDALETGSVAAVQIARHTFDPDSLAAVQAALTDEVESAAAGLLADVTDDGQTHGARALENRRRAACDLAEKVAQYERILSQTLPGLRDACAQAETAAAVAQLQLAARDADTATGDLFAPRS